MVNNLDIIIPLLEFNSKDIFYHCMVLQRKKDQLIKQNHQSVRIIKSYSIYSIDYLLEKFEEMKTLANIFNARVYINVAPKSDKKVALKMMQELLINIEHGNNQSKNLYDSVVGKTTPEIKRWVVDIDNLEFEKEIIEIINNCEPLEDKIIAKIPTLNGKHLITKPFNLEKFYRYKINEVEVHKNNPTVLFNP